MVSMISESDSRHIFPYLPLFIVMASYSASLIGGNCLERLKRKRIHHKQKSA